MNTDRVAERNGSRPQRSARKKRPTFTVAFREDAYYLGLLERGAAVYGISVHEYARQRLNELLDRQEETRLLEETSQTRAAVFELREDMARALEVLLVNLTSAGPEAIRDWIGQNLRRE
jgi:hypothetical protein